MKNQLTLGLSLSFVGWLSICLLAESAEPKDIIRDKSPDGKFALRITKAEPGGAAASDAAIIDLKSKEEVVGLEIYQNYTEQAHLVWSKDSQRVAYFEPDRRGGSATVYFRIRSKFEEVELPSSDFPECKHSTASEDATHVKTIGATTEPQKWLSSGALVLKMQSDELMENGEGQFSQTCSQLVTIAFDANHKASVQSVEEVKSH
jgi:hypothetical protein